MKYKFILFSPWLLKSPDIVQSFLNRTNNFRPKVVGAEWLAILTI